MAFGIVQQTLLDSLALTQLLEEGDEVQESQTWRNLRPEEQQQKQTSPPGAVEGGHPFGTGSVFWGKRERIGERNRAHECVINE